MANANFFGGRNSNDQYLMYMQGSTPISHLEELIAHNLTNFARTQIDRATAITVRRRRGKIVKEQVVIARAQPTGVTFTVQMGAEGEMSTPLLRRINRANCETDIFIKRICPDKPEWEHFYAALETQFDPPTFVNDLISLADTPVPVAQQAEALTPTWLISHAVGVSILADLVPPLYAAAVMTQDCADCDEGEFDSFVVVGGDGTGDSYVGITEDRFGSVTVPTVPIPADNVATSVYAAGDIILVGFADDPVHASATAGGTIISADRGVTWTVDGNLTEPIYGVSYFQGQYIAVGGVGGATPEMFTSDDGITWTNVSSLLLTSTWTLTSVAVDNDEETIYVTATGGHLLKGTKSGGTISLTALAPTSVSTTNLLRVAVFGDDHIAVGGVGGYYAESFDGGGTWVQPSVPGSGALYGLAGASKLRYMAGGTTVLAERSVLSNNDWKTKALVGGVSFTGDIRDIVSLPGEHEYFLIVTDDGEVMLSKSFETSS